MMGLNSYSHILMPKILLFGATGQCGKAFLKLTCANQTLQIIACSRNLEKADKEKLRYKHVEWIKASPFDAASYEGRLAECNLVVSFLGSQDTKNVNIYSGAYPIILKAMQDKNVHRLIAVTSAFQQSEKNFFFRKFVKPVFLDKVIADQLKLQTWLKKQYQGKVQYTVLKPFRLGDEGGKKTKSQRYRAEKIQIDNVKWQYKTDIYDLGAQILGMREKDQYSNEFINLGYTDK